MDEQSLWLAVLIQAVKDLTGFNAEDEADRVRLKGNAKAWFVSQKVMVKFPAKYARAEDNLLHGVGYE